MTQPNIFDTDPARLAELFEIGNSTDQWSTEEMRDCFEDLLSMPFETAINQLPEQLASELRSRAAELRIPTIANEARISSFGELFESSNPPLELLTFAKDFGKAIHKHERTIWRPEIGTAVYCAAIGAAWVRSKKRISTLVDEYVVAGFAEALTWPWLTEEIRTLLDKAKESLRPV